MQIALILTGGTICSRTASDGARRSDAGTALTVLEQHYRLANPYSSVQFRTFIPLNKLSEDLTPDDWCTLLRACSTLDHEKFGGIIIAHGTDTLEQTAAMLSAALCGISIPVVLVSAIAPLSDAMTNGHANFDAAVKLICRGLSGGVWAVYRNLSGETYLHRGFDLLPCQHESMDFFSSTMQPAERVRTAERIPKKSTRTDMRVLSVKALHPKDVLLLHPYNGQRYDRFSLDGTAAVVHGTYHSETANSSRYSPFGMQNLIRRCRQLEIPCYLAPCHLHDESYGSSCDLIGEGAIPLEGMTLSFAYGAVWVGCLLGYEGDALTVFVRQTRQFLESQDFRCCM